MPDMESMQALIQAVDGFQDQENSWNDTLDKFIVHIAETGDTLAPWEKVQKIFMKKLQLVLEEFYRVCPYSPGQINANATNDDFDEMKQRLLQLTEEFEQPPFTIQRLCELLVDPMKNYKKCEKFMRGLEKNLLVVTSWSHSARRTSPGNDSMVNGISLGPSNCIQPSERVSPHWANLPPSPIAGAPPKIPGAPDFTAVATAKYSTTADDKSQNAQTDDDKPSKTAPEMLKKGSSDDRKPNVSATILSSSRTITINIKRKIDQAMDNVAVNETSTQLVPESPTKKLKFDEAAEDCPESTPKQTPDDSDESAKSEESVPENIDYSSENIQVPEVTDDSVQAKEAADPESRDGTPVEVKDDSEQTEQTSNPGSTEANRVEVKDDSAQAEEDSDPHSVEVTPVDPAAEDSNKESRMTS